IFNSAAAQNVTAKELVESADSVMFCLSKGLASPIGSMVVGTGKFIMRARHIRKMLGGGMRQVGIVAAAGIISLEKMTRRLGEDHVRAKKMADGLRQVKGLEVDADSPQTNMVYLNFSEAMGINPTHVSARMKERGVLIDADNTQRLRLVTHYQIDAAAVEKAVAAFREVLNQIN
ncbi:MAG TPA: beta-eliminating lyase-related protein, partial [Anaerolineales bacterium]|nr:beta-eliminating lyase-related protein [Anaerolineales bacterium]